MPESGLEIANRFVLTRRVGGSDDVPVWQARDRGNNSSVALKLQRGAASGAGLEAEFRALRALEHPGLVKPREFLRDGELSCMVMDYAAAGDLGNLRGRAYREFLPSLRQVAHALGYLHQRGLVHGDLKPGNVLLDAAGVARLADFANLQAVGAGRSADAAFSPYSASPQQRAAHPAHPSDDIFGFGALLSELLCGQPPGYARGAADTAQLSAPLPVQPAPQRLVELANRCLRSLPAERPVSMQEVSAELDAVATMEAPTARAAPILTPPATAAEALKPNWQRSAGPVPDPVQLRRQGFRSGVAVAATAILGLVAVALFVVPASRKAAPSVAAAPAAATPTTPPETAPDLEALAREKSVADELRADVGARLAALQAADAASWSAAETAAAAASLAAVDELMQKRAYAAAQAQLETLAQALAPLEAQRVPALQSALQRGLPALEQGDAKLAAGAFAEALRINPGNAAAERGARRATTLDAVYAQIAAARVLEQQGQARAAAAAYRRALALDPEAIEAQRGAARTGGQLQADQFGRAMARAYAAISAQRDVEARAALEEARRLKPGDPEIARALAQLAAADAAAQLATALAQAHTAESAERWQEAVTQYQRALVIDATLVDARRALGLAAGRARLDAELEQLIAHPERAFSDAVYAAGRNTLQQAQAVPAPGPALSAQINRVSALLEQAATPVNVTLRSDNLTMVTVYRVGQLGSFTQRALQLKPGRYVVVGSRAGYRDVRREFNVSPGAAEPALLIQCVEPI